MDVYSPRCLCGKTKPFFNIPGQTKGECCGQCKSEDMVDVVSPWVDAVSFILNMADAGELSDSVEEVVARYKRDLDTRGMSEEELAAQMVHIQHVQQLDTPWGKMTLTELLGYADDEGLSVNIMYTSAPDGSRDQQEEFMRVFTDGTMAHLNRDDIYIDTLVSNVHPADAGDHGGFEDKLQQLHLTSSLRCFQLGRRGYVPGVNAGAFPGTHENPGRLRKLVIDNYENALGVSWDMAKTCYRMDYQVGNVGSVGIAVARIPPTKKRKK